MTLKRNKRRNNGRKMQATKNDFKDPTPIPTDNKHPRTIKIETKIGRPIKYPQVNGETVQKLASIGCNLSEVGYFFGCDSRYIIERFGDYFDKGRQNLKERLRRKQIQVALRGNVIMLIWLGKQYLDQTEKQDTKVDLKKTIKIVENLED